MFSCKSHVACPYVVKGVYCGGTFKVKLISGVSHSTTAHNVTRSNSSWTEKHLHEVKKLVDAGCKPAAIETTLTKHELRVSRRQGFDAEKRDDGGLVGARLPRHMHGAVDMWVLPRE